MTTRREFLKTGGLIAAGLALELGLDGRLRRAGEALAATPAAPAAFHPAAWLTIEPGGRTVITVGRVEMGQGIRTSLPMIIADELDTDWDAVEVETAIPGPAFREMRTSGSWSVGGRFAPLRRMGASARAMLVSAAAVRWGVAPAACATERGRVLHRASGRSLGYGELALEAAKLPVPADAPLKPPAEFRLIGHRTRRRDGPGIVTGASRYGTDSRVPGMKFATIARPPFAGATVRSVDDAAARRVPGVRDVVRLSGGVAVVGDHTWAAISGRKALRVEWAPGTELRFDSAAYRARLLAASRGTGTLGRNVGDVESALGRAARRLEAAYEYPFLVHAPLEPMNATAHARDGTCELWVSTQAPNWVQEDVAKRLGLPMEAVTVHVPLLGGGFGRRLGTDYAIEAAELSRAIAKPVQVMWTREDDTRHGYFQPAAAHRMEAGLDAGGGILAWRHREASSGQNYRGRVNPADPGLAADHMWGGVDNPYVFGAMRAEFILIEAPIPLGPWRSVFAPSNVMARECFLDEIAHETGKDPVALRLALLEEPSRDDPATQTQRRRLAAVIRLAAEKFGWGSPLPAGHGRGIAAHVYDGATTLAQIAEVSVEGGAIRVHRFVCAIDCGPVVNPLGLEAQIESGIIWGLSQTLGSQITIQRGEVQQSSYADYPILRLSQTPAIETHILEGAPQPLGAGEQPASPVAAAVLNALFAATGRRVRHVPVAAEDLG